jgi:hypothetical protein
MSKKPKSKKTRKSKKIRKNRIVRQRQILPRQNFPEIRENNNSEEMLEEYKKDKLEEKNTFYEDAPKNAEEMQGTQAQAVNERNLVNDVDPREDNKGHFSDDEGSERSTNSNTDMDNISEFNNIASDNTTVCNKSLDSDETSEINFNAIANLSILHHPISTLNHNNLPAQNQQQSQNNLHRNRKGTFERKAKIGKFG